MTEPGAWQNIDAFTASPVRLRRARSDLDPGLMEQVEVSAADAGAFALALRDGSEDAIARLRGLLKSMAGAPSPEKEPA